MKLTTIIIISMGVMIFPPRVYAQDQTQRPNRIPPRFFQPSQPIEPLPPPPPCSSAICNPETLGTQLQFNRYRLGSGDVIAITVARFPDLNFQGPINPEGNIVLPLLGTVSITGLTLEEAQEKLRQGFDRYIINPDVIISLSVPRPTIVTITGEVLQPGYYPLPPNSQLVQVLQAAGGATTKADLRKVVIRRVLLDGSMIEQSLNLLEPLKTGDNLPYLQLQNGDTIIISRLTDLQDPSYDRALVASSSIAQPQITVQVLSYAGGGIGQVTLPNGSTFLDAMTIIGPGPDVSNLQRIALIRYDEKEGKTIRKEIDAEKLLNGDLTLNTPLEDNDIIVVGRNLVGRVNRVLDVITAPFRNTINLYRLLRDFIYIDIPNFGPHINPSNRNRNNN